MKFFQFGEASLNDIEHVEKLQNWLRNQSWRLLEQHLPHSRVLAWSAYYVHRAELEWSIARNAGLTKVFSELALNLGPCCGNPRRDKARILLSRALVELGEIEQATRILSQLSDPVAYAAIAEEIRRRMAHFEDRQQPLSPPRSRQDPTHYDILGLTPNCSVEEVNRSFRMISKRAHPDKGGSVEYFLQISEAKEVLIDDVKRKKYDRELLSQGRMNLRV